MTEQKRNQLRRELAVIDGWRVEEIKEVSIRGLDSYGFYLIYPSGARDRIGYTDEASAWESALVYGYIPPLTDLNCLERVEAKVIGKRNIQQLTNGSIAEKSWAVYYNSDGIEIAHGYADTLHEAWALAIIALDKHLKEEK